MKRIALGHGVLIAALIAGCGGGGGGGNGLTTVSGGSAYTGARTDAVLDETNSLDFGSVTTTGFEFGAGINEVVNPADVALSRSAAAGRAIFRPAADAAALAGQTRGRTLARTEVENADGDCGGSVTRTTDIPDAIQFPITVTGTAQFNQYCDGGATIHGLVRYLVTVDVAGEEFSIAMTETFSGLSVSFADEGSPGETQDLLLTGTVSADITNLADAEMTVNLNIADQNTGAMVWFDYTVEATQGLVLGQETVDIDGSVYHSDHGRVSVTTKPASTLASGYVFPDGVVASLVRNTDSDTPISGGFLIEGVEGNAAIIYVLSVANGDATDGYEVILDDANPMRTFDETDTVSGPHAWE